MINVCCQCLRINPLANKKCSHCPGECQQMESLVYGQFRVAQQKKEGQKKFKKEENWEKECPDLKIFEDCRNMPNQFDLVIARP